MPVYITSDADGKRIERYGVIFSDGICGWPLMYTTPTEDIYRALKTYRKEAQKDQEEFIGYQKLCGKNDIDLAKFFKECARHHLRIQRACTLMIPWFGEPDENQKIERPLLWPIELASELDEISNRIILQGK